MTVNQMMILLDAYRGTLSRERHSGTFDKDVTTLQERGFLKLDKIPTEWGGQAIRSTLKWGLVAMEDNRQKAQKKNLDKKRGSRTQKEGSNHNV